jgi:hypothetical protein
VIYMRYAMPAPWRYTVASEDPTQIGRCGDNDGTVIIEGRGSLTLEEIMEVFDRLPQPVRKALADSAHDWAPHWGKIALAFGDAEAVIDRIARADRDEAVDREMQLLVGKG